MREFLVALNNEAKVIPADTMSVVDGNLLFKIEGSTIATYAAGGWLFGGDLAHREAIEAATAAYNASQGGS